MDRKLFIIGDLHGEFEPLCFSLIHKYNLENCDVIVAGDTGMGFYKPGYYKNIFNRMNKKFKDKNISVYFIRGNHDNPVYFSDDCPVEMTGIDNIKLVKDYEVLHLRGYNILCVGGATSIDRRFRRSGIDWWEGESVIENQDFNEPVDVIISHCAPIFIPPEYECISWMNDSDDERSRNDRRILAELYFKFSHNLKYWFYGHYHDHFETIVPNELSDTDKKYLLNGNLIQENQFSEGCKFIGLNMIDNTKLDLYELR